MATSSKVTLRFKSLVEISKSGYLLALDKQGFLYHLSIRQEPSSGKLVYHYERMNEV